MNGFEIGMILLALALASLWLSSKPDASAKELMAKQDLTEAEFKKALQAKWLEQQKEHGRRVEARSKSNG